MIDAVEDLARRWPAVAPIHRRLVRPLDVAVLGAPSTGRRTLVRGLHAMGSTSAVTGNSHDAGLDVDVLLYLLVGGLRAGDADAIAALEPDRSIVVLNKADAFCEADAVSVGARLDVAASGMRVIAVSGLWSAVTVTSDDAALLRELAERDGPPERFAARLAEQSPRHAGLVGRIGRQGIVECVAALRAGRLAGNPDDFTRLLGRRSGMPELSAALHRTGAAVRQFREARAHEELSRLAATAPGQLRDAIEYLLIGGPA